MILSGATIRQLGIITPHEPRTKFNGMSYGESFAGYDIRTNEEVLLRYTDDLSNFTLTVSKEFFKIPNNVLGVVHDKSTLARRGLSVFNTVLEPGWKGYLTLELVYHGYGLLELPIGSPIAQVVFHQIDAEVSGYDGKYQNQPQKPVSAIYPVGAIYEE